MKRKILNYSIDVIVTCLFPILVVLDVPFAIAMWSSIPCYGLTLLKQKINAK
jgi:hypothetical protein